MLPPTGAVPPGAPLLDDRGSPPLPLEMWRPGMTPPPGYRVRYTVSPTWVIGGASTLALSYTATTLVAAGIANSGMAGIFFAPIGSVPVIGGFPLAALSAMNGAGPGTVATLIALSATQSIGLGILIRGLVKRKEAGIVPDCDRPTLSLSPFLSPQVAGVAIGGAL